jgi:hypothetical protein
MSDPSRPIGLSTSGPPETILEPEPAELRAALGAALDGPADQRRAAVAAVAAAAPRSSLAWAILGDLSSNTIDAYAAYRVGYHRGLDRLRGSGWRGSGYVRWMHEGNRGFLRCLAGLERTAAAIGERDEQERCALFLLQLDPSWPPADLDAPAVPPAGG